MSKREHFHAFLLRYKPGVPKRILLLAAALAWTTAGIMLGLRGTSFLLAHGDHLALRFTVAIVLGLVFFQVVFAKVSLKHLRRIHAIDLVRPCLFSFFDFRGYLMMALMISGGIGLRLSGLVDMKLLANFYVLMGTPLLVSALRFYYAFWRYPRLIIAGTLDRKP